MKIDRWQDIELELTCDAFPEQYDARFAGVQVGYLRLRWGNFTVTCPDVGGTEVLYVQPEEGFGDFATDEERTYYLAMARQSIARWINSDEGQEKLYGPKDQP